MAQALAGDHGAQVVGLENFLLISGVDGALLRAEEAGAHLHPRRPQHEGRCHPPAVGNAAGGDDGQVGGVTPWGTRTMVVSSPTWPPLSPPSAMRAEAPSRVMSLAMATEATTGITLIPASFHWAMNLVGFLAPVVTTATFSSATTWATSSTKGLMSMIFTPKGRWVRDLAMRICSRT